jgi:hypothetical protein
MYPRKAHQLRQQWQLQTRSACFHQHYEAETVLNIPTGQLICSHCGKVLTTAEVAVIQQETVVKQSVASDNFIG